MKLPKFRALVLLGLLTLAGMLTPREGAALRIIGGWEDDPIHSAGDPDSGGWGKGAITRDFILGATTPGSEGLIARLRFGLRLVDAVSLTKRTNSGSRTRQ